MEELKTHSKEVCEPPCAIHAPSNHPLKDAPMHFRDDKNFLIERICEHGVGHDDPDSVAYMHKHGMTWAGLHGCDGCCHEAPTSPTTPGDTTGTMPDLKEAVEQILGNTLLGSGDYMEDQPKPYAQEAISLLTDLIKRERVEAAKEVLMDVRFNSYWGDGSPSYVDRKIQELDPSYDAMKKLEELDGGGE